jgi:hypothetical protein
MNDLVNISEIIKRIKEIEGLRYNKDVAALWGLSNNDFSNRKRRGTLLVLLVTYGIEKGLSLNWLLTGKYFETHNGNNVADLSLGWRSETRVACRTVKDILESGDEKTALALRQNIDAFEASVTRLNENKKLKEEKRIKALKPRTGTD